MKKGIKGFYTLEAAIFLPVLILAVLSLGYFMRMYGGWEQCIYIALNESSKSSMKACDMVSPLFIKTDLTNRFSKDGKEFESVNISGMKIMYKEGSIDSLTSYKLDMKIKLKLPLGFENDQEFSTRIKYRNFVGRKQKTSGIGSDMMETENDADIVWIFPFSGRKYHSRQCTYVTVSPKKYILDSRVKRIYRPCSICTSVDIQKGRTVYCFKEGDVYHRGICPVVNKRIMSIEETEAKERGYTPCSKCGG